MSTPAELLALKHAQASTTAELSSPAPTGSSAATPNSVQESVTTASSASGDDIINEVAEVKPKKVIRMDDDAYFPSLGDATGSVPVSWGPASDSAKSTWAKPISSFKPAVKSS